MIDQAGTADRHAVVVGGGIGGLLAGLGLRRWFSRVTIVERDRFTAAPAPRRGAPQGRCLHMLMAAGLRVVEGLVPGLRQELVRAGAVPFDVGSGGALRLPAGWLPRAPAGIEMLACSRALLEHVLLQRVRAEPGVRLVQGCAVRGLRAVGGRVVGVRVAAGAEPVDAAALTVVASGARSALGRWWAELGLPPVAETVVEARHHYVSRWFETPASFDGDWKLMSVAPAAGAPWGGAIFAAEGGRWGMVLVVPEHEPVPSSDAELLGACMRLVDRRLHDVLVGARPLSPIVRHDHVGSRLAHLERVPEWPAGLAVVGDAVCTLDPYFGLGMTSCARGVAALVDHGWDEPGAAQAFQRRLAAIVEVPWRLATGDVSGDPHAAWHRHRVAAAAPHSPALARLLLRRMHLLDPPEAVDGPEVVALVRAVVGASGRAG